MLVILVIAGIKYLTSGGEAKAVQSAHQTVTWGLLGIVFLALAWLILQLIQNFTGIEVTKFTLASLPGVEGFTGSCWAEAPVTKNINNPTKNDEKALSSICKLQSQYDSPVYLCTIECKSSEELFRIAESNVSSIAYVGINSFDEGGELSKVIDRPKLINILGDVISPDIYALKDNFKDYTSGLIASERNSLFTRSMTQQIAPIGSEFKFTLTESFLGGFGKYEKDVIPEKLLKGRLWAQQYFKDTFNLGNPDIVFITGSKPRFSLDEVYLTRFSCPDADYYQIITLTPLIYFYPLVETKISARVLSLLTSPLSLTSSSFWTLKAHPDGSFVTAEGEHLKYISYEFFRKDFKRPKDGFVVDKEHLISFLKDNLWKKLGLTEQEIDDYWQDIGWRIPGFPYYFVSLIDRSEIDRVLPMEVNPKPDTVIRNMTYILPLDQPFIPTPVKLEAPTRTGFTVLENGGFIDGF